MTNETKGQIEREFIEAGEATVKERDPRLLVDGGNAPDMSLVAKCIDRAERIIHYQNANLLEKLKGTFWAFKVNSPTWEKSTLGKIIDKKAMRDDKLKRKSTVRKRANHSSVMDIPLEELGGVEHNARWNKVMDKRRLIAMEK